MLGDILAALHQPREALAAFREALRIREKALGPDNPRTADVVSAIGRLMWREGDAAGARPLLERALRIYEKSYGARHSKTVGVRAFLQSAAPRAGVHVGTSRAAAGPSVRERR